MIPVFRSISKIKKGRQTWSSKHWVHSSLWTDWDSLGWLSLGNCARWLQVMVWQWCVCVEGSTVDQDQKHVMVIFFFPSHNHYTILWGDDHNSCSKRHRWSIHTGFKTTISSRHQFGQFICFNSRLYKGEEDACCYAFGVDWFWRFIGRIGRMYC